MGKPKSIRKMWLIIICLWLFTIFCQPGIFIYYEFVVSNLEIAYFQKQIYVIVSLILWFLYPVVVFLWAFFFIRKAKKEPQFNLVRKYLFDIEKKIDVNNLDKKYLKFLNKNLEKYGYFLNLLVIISTCFLFISAIIVNANDLDLILLIVLPIVLFWIPSYLNVYFLIKYRDATFV